MKKHYQEEIPSENLLYRLDELEKEEAKVVWMEKYYGGQYYSVGTSPKEGAREMVRIIYKKER